MKKNRKFIIIGTLIFIIGFYVYSMDDTNVVVTLGVEKDNHLLVHFQEKFPNNKVITCGYEDFNGDGRKDLLVIYKEGKKKNGMRIVLDTVEGYKFTDHTHAPIENQKIEFMDIDDTPPIEFSVSGSKDGKFGYAIFRLVDDFEIRDLFGEGMNECC